MHAGKSIVLVPVLLLAMSASALAQPGVPANPDDDGYVAAFAGAVSGPPTEPLFAVEYAENVGRRAQAYVSLGYVDNLMTEDTRDAVMRLGADWLAPLTGVPQSQWSFSGRDRAITLTAGGKYIAGTGSVRPYVGAGAGVINLKRTITEARLGEVTQAVFNDFGVGSPELSLAPRGTTRPLGEIVAGVGFAAGHTYVDVGYRYRRAFRFAEDLDFSQFSVGVGYRF